jgi:hypothetical protein
VVVALTVIALQRTGKVQRSNWRRLSTVVREGRADRVDFSDENLDEDDALPPVSSSADETKQREYRAFLTGFEYGARENLLETNHDLLVHPV